MSGHYHNRRGMIAGLAIAAMGAAAAAFAGVKEAATDGVAAIKAFTSMTDGPTFGQRYGANPRSTGNGGASRGAVMRSKRDSIARRNKAKHGKGSRQGNTASRHGGRK